MPFIKCTDGDRRTREAKRIGGRLDGYAAAPDVECLWMAISVIRIRYIMEYKYHINFSELDLFSHLSLCSYRRRRLDVTHNPMRLQRRYPTIVDLKTLDRAIVGC